MCSVVKLWVITTTNAYCTTCGVPMDSGGLYQRMSDLSLPEETNTFFSTKKGWPSAPWYDRDILFTEDVLEVLKQGCIAGGYATRLWNEEEDRKYNEMLTRGKDIRPLPGTCFCLNGKPLKVISKRDETPPSIPGKQG